MKLDLTMPTIDYDALPSGKKYLLLLLPATVIIALALVFFILPAFDEREILSKEISQQENELTIARQKTVKLEKLIAENNVLKTRLQELQLQLPEEKEVSTLLRQTSEKGIESGLIIALWKPGTRAVHPSNEIYTIPVEVSMSGSYHNFGLFFAEITKLSRIVNLSNINIKSAAQKRATSSLSVTLTAVTYSLIPEAERKALQEAAQKEAAKKK